MKNGGNTNGRFWHIASFRWGAVTATTDFLAADTLDKCGRAGPAPSDALHSTLATMTPLAEGRHRRRAGRLATGPRQKPVRLRDLSTDDRAVHRCEKLLTLPWGAFSGITRGDHTNDGIFDFMDARTERTSPPTSFARKGADGL